MFNESAKKIKVLFVCSNLNSGGVQHFLINNFMAIDKDAFDVSFCVLNRNHDYYDDYVIKNGGSVYKITSFLTDKKMFVREFDNLLKTKHFDIIHTHLNFLSLPVLKICKKNHVKIRICHSHAAYKASNFLSYIYRQYFKFVVGHYANGFCACSSEASKWLFGKRKKDVFIMDGSIAFDSYKFDEKIRSKKRTELDALDKKIIINVASLTPIKNHLFLIKAFSMFPNEKALLIICGSGDNESILKEEINRLNLLDKVLLLGNRDDISDLLSASDLFVLPSLAEGLSLSTLEAQANGLPCLLSTGVPKSIDISGNCYFFNPNIIDELITLLNNQYSRKDISFETHYNISFSIKNVQKYYIDLVNRYNKKVI